MAKPRNYQREAIDQFLSGLPADAPVRAIVRSRAVQDRLDAFGAADADAIDRQARQRFWGRIGRLATTFGTVVGAVLLLPLDQQLKGDPRQIIGTSLTVALVVALGAGLVATWLKPLKQWRSRRAEAEQQRGLIFQTILDSTPMPDSDLQDLAVQKRDLVMAAYIEDQLRFFEKRIREHKAVASDYSPLRILGYLVIGLSVLLGLVSFAHGKGLAVTDAWRPIAEWLALTETGRWQLGLTTIASGILAYAAARGADYSSARTTAMYQLTATKLHRLMDRDLRT